MSLCACMHACVCAHLSGLQSPDGGVGAALQRAQAALELPALPLRYGRVVHSLSNTHHPVSRPDPAHVHHARGTYVRHNPCLLCQTLGGVQALGGGACESGRQSVHLLGQELTSLPGLETTAEPSKKSTLCLHQVAR